GGEARPERAALALHGASPGEQARDVLADEDPVLPAPEQTAQGGRVVCGRRRARADPSEQVTELRPDGLHVAERDARGDQPDELAIELLLVAVDEPDRIRLAARADVAARADRVERLAQGAPSLPLP